jgi:Arc/MetJ family transcription regulator
MKAYIRGVFMSRLTATLDDELLKQAQSVLATRTKRETIETALREVVRQEKIRKALKHKGQFDLGFSREDLLRRRSQA